MLLWFWLWERKCLRRIGRQYSMARVQRCKRICIQSVQGGPCSCVLIKRSNWLYLNSWGCFLHNLCKRAFFNAVTSFFFIMSFKTRPSVKNPFFSLLHCSWRSTKSRDSRSAWKAMDYRLPMCIGRRYTERESARSDMTVLGEALSLVNTCTSKLLDSLQGLLLLSEPPNAILLVISWLEVVYIQHAEIPSVGTSKI